MKRRAERKAKRTAREALQIAQFKAHHGNDTQAVIAVIVAPVPKREAA